MKTLYIHIGPHKTGTTSLQFFLHKERKNLLSQGVLFPECRVGAWESQHRLAFSLRNMADHRTGDKPERDTEFSALLRTVEASDAQKVILSAEDFFAIKPDAIQYMRDKLYGFDIRLIFYARRQDETIVSSFSQKIKGPRSGFAKPIHAFIDEPDVLNRDFDIYGRVSEWAAIFGKESIVPRLYARTIDICADFLNLVGGEALARAASGTATYNKNEKPLLEVLEFMRVYKAHEPDRDKRLLALQALTRHFDGKGHKATDLLSTADRRQILEHYRPGNERLFAEYFGSENLFDPDRLLTGEHTDRVTVDTSNAIAFINDLVAKDTVYKRTKGGFHALLHRLRTVLPISRRQA